MQFIPSTWRGLQRDGNDDGKADPQNYYDQALAAAAYLCRRGPGLDTDAGLRRAFRSYNNDGSYVELVLQRTHWYARHRLPLAGNTGANADLVRVPLPPAPPAPPTTRPAPIPPGPDPISPEDTAPDPTTTTEPPIDPTTTSEPPTTTTTEPPTTTTTTTTL
jgi:hypothetical protein